MKKNQIIICSALLSFLFTFGPTQPGWAYNVFNRAYTCPLGGEEFQELAVASYSTMGMRLDLKPFGPDFIIPLPIPVCPSNGFVIYQEEFSEEELQTLEPIIMSPEYQTLKDGNTSYFLLSYIYEQMGESKTLQAELMIKATWQAEKNGPDQYLEYLTVAMEKIEAALSEHEPQSDDWWKYQMLLANFDRKLSNFNQALERIDTLPLDDLDKDHGVHRFFDAITRLSKEQNPGSHPKRWGDEL